MFEVLVVIAIVVVGLMVGVELAVAVFVNPIFDRLPQDGGLAARSDAARVLGRVMPFWYITSLALTAVWATLSWGRLATGPVVVAGALLVASVVMTVLLLVPVNSRVATWSTSTPPANWRRQLSRWDRLHHLRVAVITTAFTLLVIGAT